MNPLSWAVTELAGGAKVCQSTWPGNIFIAQVGEVYPRQGPGLLPFLRGTPYTLVDDGSSTWQLYTGET